MERGRNGSGGGGGPGESGEMKVVGWKEEGLWRTEEAKRGKYGGRRMGRGQMGGNEKSRIG